MMKSYSKLQKKRALRPGHILQFRIQATEPWEKALSVGEKISDQKGWKGIPTKTIHFEFSYAGPQASFLKMKIFNSQNDCVSGFQNLLYLLLFPGIPTWVGIATKITHFLEFQFPSQVLGRKNFPGVGGTPLIFCRLMWSGAKLQRYFPNWLFFSPFFKYPLKCLSLPFSHHLEADGYAYGRASDDDRGVLSNCVFLWRLDRHS